MNGTRRVMIFAKKINKKGSWGRVFAMGQDHSRMTIWYKAMWCRDGIPLPGPPRSANFPWKGPHSKYLRLWGPYGDLRLLISAVLAQKPL